MALLSRAFRTLSLSTVGYAGICSYTSYSRLGGEKWKPSDVYNEMRFGAKSAYRFVYTVGVGALIMTDYKWSLRDSKTETMSASDLRTLKSTVNLRNAQRFLSLSLSLQGSYIKAGQYISQLNHVLSPEYTDTLRVLQDNVPTHSWSETLRMLHEELGCDVGTVQPHFSVFPDTPVASGSLAQVYKARLAERFGGEWVAVKIQHPDVKDLFHADIVTMKFLAWVAEIAFKDDHQLSHIVPEFEKALLQELDFDRELHNAQELQSLSLSLSPSLSLSHLIVPTPIERLSTRSVLTMEWVDGVKVTEVEEMRRLGLEPAEVMEEVTRVFATQMFLFGFVHCDPHPGNVFVSPYRHPVTNRPRIILLDHGLYQRLSEDMRRHWARLWNAVIWSRYEDLKSELESMGLPSRYWFVLALTLSATMLDPDLSFHGHGDKEKEREREGETAGEREKERLLDSRNSLNRQSLKLLRKRKDVLHDAHTLFIDLPRELLLLLRCNTYVGALNRAVGSPINRFEVMAPIVLQGSRLSHSLSLSPQSPPPSLSLYDRFRLFFVLSVWKAVFYVVQWATDTYTRMSIYIEKWRKERRFTVVRDKLEVEIEILDTEEEEEEDEEREREG